MANVEKPGARLLSHRMANVEKPGARSLSHRLETSVVIFFVVAAGIYATAYVTLGLLRHVVMPAISVVVAGYLAVKVFRYRGGSNGSGSA